MRPNSVSALRGMITLSVLLHCERLQASASHCEPAATPGTRDRMKLYFHPLSSNARRARLVVHHLGLAVEEELVDLTQGAQRRPAYLALNPNGKVPTLVDGDLKLWESYAIMIYLCEKHGRRELYPDELATRTE